MKVRKSVAGVNSKRSRFSQKNENHMCHAPHKRALSMATCLFVATFFLPTMACGDELSELKGQLKVLQQQLLSVSKKVETLENSQQAAGSSDQSALDPKAVQLAISQYAADQKAAEIQAGADAAAKPKHERTDDDHRKMSRAKLLEDGLLPGFITFPGTNTQFKIDGFVRVDTFHNFNKMNISNDPGLYAQGVIMEGQPGHGESGGTFINPSTTRIGLDIRTPTPGFGKYDSFDVYVESDFYPDSSALRVRQAYGEWGPFRVGQVWPMWMDLQAMAPAFDFAGPVSGTVVRIPEIKWEEHYGEHSRFGVALDSPDGELFIPTDDGSAVAQVNNGLPDLTLRYVNTQERGHIQLAGLARRLKTESGIEQYYNDSAFAWGTALSGALNVFDKDKLGISLTYGEGLGRWRTSVNGLNSDAVLTEFGLETVKSYGGFVTYVHTWNPKLTTSLVYSYLKSDNPIGSPDSATEKNNYLMANLLWHPNPLMNVVAEFTYVDRTNLDGAFGDGYRFNIGFVYKFHKSSPESSPYGNLSYLFGGG
jgi:hypothetical protein